MSRILIVDDDVLTIRILKLMLERLHHDTAAVHNGQEALTYLANNDVDLVITDVNMPVMDGLTLLERMCTDGRFPHLPVVVLTASSNGQLPKLARQKGATGFLSQPFSSRELERVVAECLRGTESAQMERDESAFARAVRADAR